MKKCKISAHDFGLSEDESDERLTKSFDPQTLQVVRNNVARAFPNLDAANIAREEAIAAYIRRWHGAGL